MAFDLSPCHDLLQQDPVRYLDLTEPLARGEGHVAAVSSDGVLVALSKNYKRDGRTTGFSMLARTPQAARQLLDLLPSELDLLILHEDFSAAMAAERFSLNMSPPCYQAAYLKTEPMPLPDTNAVVRTLTTAQLPILVANYSYGSEDYLRYLLACGALFGAFDGNVLMGFVGRHAEGSIGLLEVLPPYRRRKLATLLQGYMVNLELSLGHTPYGQIIEGNEPSLALQRSLGMTFASGQIWFASRE